MLTPLGKATGATMKALSGLKAAAAAGCAGALILTAFGASASTDLTGDTIDVHYIVSGTLDDDLGTLVAPGGGELSPELSYSVSGDQITFTNILPGDLEFLDFTFQGFTFTDMTKTPDITGITLDSSTTAAVSASDASWSGDEILINFANQTFGQGQSAVFDIDFAAAAPEPAAWALMLAGFAGLGAMMRRRRAATAA